MRNSVDRTLRVLDPEGMDVRLHADPEDFWNAAGPIYESDPIRHTIPLTVITGLRAEYRQPQNASGQISDVYGTKPLLVTITEHGETVGAAYCTPPWPLGVSGVTIDHIPALAEFLRDIGVELAGVSGPCEVADAFAEKWGSSTTAAMRMRCYRLAELIPPDVPGSMRLAQAEDIPLLEAWEAAFFHDAQMPVGRPNHRRQIVQSLALGNAHGLWHDDGVVRSMARASAQLHGMSRVGMVYTPPEHRRRGYGAAVTAAVSQWALDQGARDVVLFTDLDNPTSNSIYQKIGYRPVYDAVEYRFPTTVA